MCKLVLPLFLLLFSAPIYGTVLIYDDFSESGSLDANTPPATVGATTWLANAVFTSSGSVLSVASTTSTSGKAGSIDLGANYFVTNPGIYELSMTVNLSSSNTTATTFWALGFSATASSADNNALNTAGSAGEGSPWILIRNNGQASVFAGPGATNNLVNNQQFTTGQSHALKLVLDTTTSLWSLDAFIDTTQLDLNAGGAGSTFSFTTNPTIRYAGLTSNLTNSTGRQATADDFKLESIPESSAGLLVVLGLVGAIWLRHRR